MSKEVELRVPPIQPSIPNERNQLNEKALFLGIEEADTFEEGNLRGLVWNTITQKSARVLYDGFQHYDYLQLLNVSEQTQHAMHDTTVPEGPREEPAQGSEETATSEDAPEASDAAEALPEISAEDRDNPEGKGGRNQVQGPS